MEKYTQQLIAKHLGRISKPLEISLGNNSPILTLTCQECGILKKSAEEMEVHIKVEHINWLPFKCPQCKVLRASDAQMREHIHASHKNKSNEFLYLDNLESKRKLGVLMDQALYATLKGKVISDDYEGAMSPEASSAAHSTTSSDSPPGEPSSPTAEAPEAMAKVEIMTGSDSATDAILASITQAAAQSAADDSSLDPLALLLKSYTQEGEIEGELKDEGAIDLANNLSILDSLFKGATTDAEANKRQSTQQSKKKIVGMCRACNKPVTAGARQMHLFFHLAKDYRTFRFFCQAPGCNVEHYRKDQMEHHMTKVHGRIEPEWIGDNTDRLYQKCKELQQELLGEMVTITTDSNNSTPSGTTLQKRPAPPPATHPPDDKQTLQCNKCLKFMENRVKGFHILHHLARDRGILRYTCKLCDFAHDRSQSVLGHGKKEHNREDIVLDRIADYEEDVQEMSQQCFGIDTNFETSKKKAKGSGYIERMPKLLEGVFEEHSDNDERMETKLEIEEDFVE